MIFNSNVTCIIFKGNWHLSTKREPKLTSCSGGLTFLSNKASISSLPYRNSASFMLDRGGLYNIPPPSPPWGSVRALNHSGPNFSAVSAIVQILTRSGNSQRCQKVGLIQENCSRTSVKNLPRSIVDCASLVAIS